MLEIPSSACRANWAPLCSFNVDSNHLPAFPKHHQEKQLFPQTILANQKLGTESGLNRRVPRSEDPVRKKSRRPDFLPSAEHRVLLRATEMAPPMSSHCTYHLGKYPSVGFVCLFLFLPAVLYVNNHEPRLGLNPSNPTKLYAFCTAHTISSTEL